MGLKIRFGYTIGPDQTADELAGIVDDLERLGFDSLWVPEAFLVPTLDPIVALTFAAARTDKLKIGSHLVIPGKNPVQLARQLAHLDRVSDGRLLIVGVLGLPDEADTGAQLMARSERVAAMDEVVPLLRKLWTGETIDHDGPRYQLRDVTVTPTPVQDPLEIWLAGKAPSALRRIGELGEGWMPGLMTPPEAAALLPAIHDAAADAGRAMDPEHFGVNLLYATGPISPAVSERLASRTPSGDVGALVPTGWPALRERVHEWVDAGFSKFLLRPVEAPADRQRALEELAEEILPLTTS